MRFAGFWRLFNIVQSESRSLIRGSTHGKTYESISFPGGAFKPFWIVHFPTYPRGRPVPINKPVRVVFPTTKREIFLVGYWGNKSITARKIDSLSLLHCLAGC